MKRFRKILVALDGTNEDLSLLSHVNSIKQVMDVRKVFFVHVTKNLDITYAKNSDYEQHLANRKENIQALILADIQEMISGDEHDDFEIHVEEGERLKVLQDFVAAENIDLLVMGRKARPGITHFSKQLANSARCSVLFVPHETKSRYNRIVVPIDFSKVSRIALERAVNYQGSVKNVEVLPVHFYEVPSGYTKTGKSYFESADLMKQIADNKIRETIPGQYLGKYESHLDRGENAPLKIFNYALSKGADLIIIGSKGRTKLAAFIKNSISSKLVELIYHIPILIDKKHGARIMGANAAIAEL